MNPIRQWSRRDFLRALAVALGGVTVGETVRRCFQGIAPIAQGDFTPTARTYLPLVMRSEPTPTPTPTRTPTPTSTPTRTPTHTSTPTSTPTRTSTPTSTPTRTSTPTSTPTRTPTPSSTPTPWTPAPGNARVVHVHDANATSWNFSTGWYGAYVNQSKVNAMVDAGVMALTGASTVADAWRTLVPNYEYGRAIAIKVNFNNSGDCAESDNQIDALIHPINAIVCGLKQMGVAEQDIWVYDAIRPIPDRFVNGCLYPGVQFFGGCREAAGFDYNNPATQVTFRPPTGVPAPSTNRVTDVVLNASYLINMPIVKTHDGAGITLGFKNHLGTINDPGGLHEHIFLGGRYFRSDYNPLVDLYLHPAIVDKTVLTVGDCLFGGCSGYNAPPSPWATFGNKAPNSLFFSTDPVAIDCVMYDFLDAETIVPPQADYYLIRAAAASIGGYEHGDPWGSGYDLIDYVKITLT